MNEKHFCSLPIDAKFIRVELTSDGSWLTTDAKVLTKFAANKACTRNGRLVVMEQNALVIEVRL